MVHREALRGFRRVPSGKIDLAILTPWPMLVPLTLGAPSLALNDLETKLFRGSFAGCGRSRTKTLPAALIASPAYGASNKGDASMNRDRNKEQKNQDRNRTDKQPMQDRERDNGRDRFSKDDNKQSQPGNAHPYPDSRDNRQNMDNPDRPQLDRSE
jgi:hypothetical protein